MYGQLKELGYQWEITPVDSPMRENIIMSMILICESKNDLSEYGLTELNNVYFKSIEEIRTVYKLNGVLWSSDHFDCLCTEAHCKVVIDGDEFYNTELYHFLNKIIDLCNAIVMFYYEPFANDTYTDKEKYIEKIKENIQDYMCDFSCEFYYLSPR